MFAAILDNPLLMDLVQHGLLLHVVHIVMYLVLHNSYTHGFKCMLAKLQCLQHNKLELMQ
jgi:hypothetical protein